MCPPRKGNMPGELKGMEYRVVKAYPDGRKLIIPVQKFGSEKLILARGDDILAPPVAVDDDIETAIKLMEEKTDGL